MTNRPEIQYLGKRRYWPTTQSDWDRACRFTPPEVLAQRKAKGLRVQFFEDVVEAWQEWGCLTERQAEAFYGDLAREYASDRFAKGAAKEIALMPRFPELVERVQSGEAVKVAGYTVKQQSNGGDMTIKIGAKLFGTLDPRGFVIGHCDYDGPDFRVDPWTLTDAFALEFEPVTPAAPTPPAAPILPPLSARRAPPVRRGFWSRLFGGRG